MKSVLLWAWLLFCSLPVHAGEPVGRKTLVDAPCECIVLKHDGYKRRFGDISTRGRFSLYKVEIVNRDRVEHDIDYDCFCLVDDQGFEYPVNVLASAERETRWEDFRTRDLDNRGFSYKSVKPNFRLKGWLVFEVPAKGDNYQVKFRGYLK